MPTLSTSTAAPASPVAAGSAGASHAVRPSARPPTTARPSNFFVADMKVISSLKCLALSCRAKHIPTWVRLCNLVSDS
ncbi:hypothetical protein ACFPRL_15545 [Pseudoclavibacter helvolus]